MTKLQGLQEEFKNPKLGMRILTEDYTFKVEVLVGRNSADEPIITITGSKSGEAAKLISEECYNELIRVAKLVQPK